MIKPHQFIGLAGATAVSLLVALGLYANANRWSAGVIEGEPFLPGLAAQLGQVAAIEVAQGGKTLTLARADGAWRLRDNGGYPAKPEAVRQLIVALAEAQLIEKKTAVESKLALLELEDPAGKDAKSKGIRLVDGSGKPIASVVLGKTRWDAFGSGRGGTYARRTNETQSWLATGNPKVTTIVADWVESNIYAIEKEKVARVTVEHPGEAPMVIEKGPPPAPPAKPAEVAAAGTDAAKAKVEKPAPPAKPEAFHLVGLAADKKFKQGEGVEQIVEAFNTLDLDDVRKLDGTPKGDTVTVLKLEQLDGMTITFRLNKDGEARWISLEAAGKDGEAKSAADALNARAKGWEFKIPTWRGDQMTKRRADLLETT